MKKFISAIIIGAMTLSLAGCNNTTEAPAPSPEVQEESETPSEEPEESPAVSEEPEESAEPSDEPSDAPDLSDFSFGMITDTGGVNDQSFNQSAWEGLSALGADTNADVTYLESQQESQYGSNIDIMIDQERDIIWGIGFLMADAILNAANTNPGQTFAIIDYDFNDGASAPANTISVMFRAEEPSFMAGYMAGYVTETDSVGFIGGIESPTIDQFEYGFRAGVAYAAKEQDKEIEVKVQYAESFSDSAIGKAIATTMFSTGADIVFHAAGNVGQGVIETAKDMNKLAIGVDLDQSDLAPDNVMTSVLKKVGQAMYETCVRVAQGEDLGGKTIAYGIVEDAAGLPAYEGSTAALVDKEIYDMTMKIQDDIMNGKIDVPNNNEDYLDFMSALQ